MFEAVSDALNVNVLLASRSLYVGNVPVSFDQQRLAAEFAQFGPIESTFLMRNESQAVRRLQFDHLLLLALL